MRRASTLSRYITELAFVSISVAGQRYLYSDIPKFRSVENQRPDRARRFAERPGEAEENREICETRTDYLSQISPKSNREIMQPFPTIRRASIERRIEWSPSYTSAPLACVASRDRFARLSSTFPRAARARNTARDTGDPRSREHTLESTLSRASPSPTSRRPFYSPSPFLNRRSSSIVAFDRSPRYPRGTRDTSSSSSLRGSPRRAERRASRRGSAARSASAPRAFLSLERPRGSPVGYLARCFAVGRVAYCPGEPRLRPP